MITPREVIVGSEVNEKLRTAGRSYLAESSRHALTISYVGPDPGYIGV
jgi:hypothetical protein